MTTFLLLTLLLVAFVAAGLALYRSRKQHTVVRGPHDRAASEPGTAWMMEAADEGVSLAAQGIKF